MASLTQRLKALADASLAGPQIPGYSPEEEKHLTSGFRFPDAKDRVVSPNWLLGSGKWDLSKATKNGYDANEWVYTCISEIAGPASTVPWRVSRFTGDTKEERQETRKQFAYEAKGMAPLERMKLIRKAHDILEPEPGHPLEQLMDEPNPFMDTQALMESALQHLLLTGNSLLTKVRTKKTPVNAAGPLGGSLPLELWLINPDEISPRKDKKKFIAWYEAPVPGRREPDKVSVHDLIHLKLHNPSDPTWGQSPLMSAAKTVDADVQAISWNKSSFENRAVPDGIFFTETTGVMRDEDFEVQRRQLKSQYQGTDNARTPILAAGLKDYRQLSMTPVEMDFIRSRGMNRESIFGIYGVDTRILGLGDAGQGSKKEIRRDHWISVILPALDRIQSVLNRYLAREFGDDLLLWYDARNVEALRESHHEKVRSAGLLGRMGVPMTALNRVYELGFTESELEYLDKGYMPASTRSVEEIRRSEEQARLNPNPQNPNSESPDGGEQIEENPGGDNPSPGEQEDPMDADSNRKGIWDAVDVDVFLGDRGFDGSNVYLDDDLIKAQVDPYDNNDVIASIIRDEIPGVKFAVPFEGGPAELWFNYDAARERVI